jgi:hypothetical protein
MWASNTVVKPKVKPTLIKRSIKEIPVTISAFNIGIFVMPIKIARPFFFILRIARQAIVPINVAKREAKKAIINVLYNAVKITSSSKSARYHLKVNPPHFARVLLALKDKTISVAIGAYKKIIIKTK